MSYFSYLKEYLFPSGCGACGEALLEPEDAWFGLCAGCRAYLSTAFAEEKRCDLCGKPLISEKTTCISCRTNEAADTNPCNKRIAKLNAIFPYSGKFRSVLGAYKFNKSLGVGNFLVRSLTTAIGDLIVKSNEDFSEAALVPVPPRPRKIKAQGWDQVEYLAGLLDKEYKRATIGIPVYRCLKRLSSKSQKELNREERICNLSKRILCVKPPPGIAVLFDDVITTGATLDACAEALLEKGVIKVYGVCLFYD